MSSLKLFSVIQAITVLLLTSTIPCWGLSKNEIREMQEAASEMNKGLPMMTSKEIQLTRVYLQGDNEMRYQMKTIIHSKNQLATPETIKPSAVNGLCSNPNTSKMIKKGVKYTHVFYDKDNKYAYEYSITAKDCGF